MKEIWAIIAVVIGNESLQEAAAGPIARFLRAQLPDATEPAIAAFLCRVAQDIETQAT